jgi:hypothetical protein
MINPRKILKKKKEREQKIICLLDEEHTQIDRPFSSFIKSMLIHNEPITHKNRTEDAIRHKQIFVLKFLSFYFYRTIIKANTNVCIQYRKLIEAVFVIVVESFHIFAK